MKYPQNWIELSSLNEVRLIMLVQETNDVDKIINFFMNNYSKNRDLREAHEKSFNEMEEVKRFQGSTFETIARRKLIEDQDTILLLIGKIQKMQNEINFMNDSRVF